ncbi:MAG TPA: hypothetical protein PK231_05195 [Acidocella sp.]|nr:hypothetical protein [Acidocella sp.]
MAFALNLGAETAKIVGTEPQRSQYFEAFRLTIFIKIEYSGHKINLIKLKPAQ